MTDIAKSAHEPEQHMVTNHTLKIILARFFQMRNIARRFRQCEKKFPPRKTYLSAEAMRNDVWS